MDKKLKKDKNSFLIVWISCIVLLLTMCYFGVNSSLKGTSAADASCYCPFFADVKTGGVDGKQYCSITRTQSISGWNCASAPNADGTTFYECASYDACVSLDKLSCSKDGWVAIKSSGDSTKTACCPDGYKYYSSVEKLHEWNIITGGTEMIEYKDGVCVKNPIYVSEVNSLSNSTWSFLQAQTYNYCVKAPSENGDCTSGEKHDGYCRTSEMSLCTKRPSSPIIIESVPEACYYDATKHEYVWGSYSTGATINKVDISVKSECLAQNNPKKCFICSAGNSTYSGSIYAWVSSTSGLSCNTSWSDASTIEESECKEKPAGKFLATFDGNNGTPEKKEESCIYKVGTGSCDITMPGASRNGYTFDGWTKTKDSCFSPIKKGSTPTITSDVKYYACWTEKSSGGGPGGDTSNTPSDKTFTGTFMNDSTQFATTTCTTSGGNSCTLPAPTTNPTKDGYTFKGWGSSGCTDGWIGNKSGVSSNQTYYACWLSNTPAGTSKPSGGNVSTNPGTGPIAIAITWFVGIFAIAYSVFYFKKIKES